MVMNEENPREVIRQRIDRIIAAIPLKVAQKISDSQLREKVRLNAPWRRGFETEFEEELSAAAKDFFKELPTPQLFTSCTGGPLAPIPPQKPPVPLPFFEARQEDLL